MKSKVPLLRVPTSHAGSCREIEALSSLIRVMLQGRPAGNQGEDLKSTIQAILTSILPLICVEALSAVTYDGATERLVLSSIVGLPRHEPDIDEAQKVGLKLTGMAFAEGRHLVSNALEEDSRADQAMVRLWGARLKTGRLRHGVFIPFNAQLECRGVLRFFNRLNGSGDLANGFSDSDLEILLCLTKVFEARIQSIWERQQSLLMRELSRRITDSQDARQAANDFVQTAIKIANCRFGLMYISDVPGQDYLHTAASWGFAKRSAPSLPVVLDHSIEGDVIKRQVSRVIHFDNFKPSKPMAGLVEAQQLKSCILVPMVGRSVQGVIEIFAQSMREFHRSTIDILEHMGRYAAGFFETHAKSLRMDMLLEELAVTGHSLRSPLQGIASKAYQLRRMANISESPTFNPVLADLFRELGRATRRIDSMLYSRRDVLGVAKLNLGPVRLGQILESCVDRQSPHAKKRNVKLVLWDSAKRLPRIVGDEDKLDLVFDNLLENAIKYSWANQAVDITGDATSREVRVILADKGLGIPEDYFDLIFEEFVRSPILDNERYVPGTGLGLKIVKLILEAHGGRVSVSSTPFLNDPVRLARLEGFATTFTVVIPTEQREGK
jgi:signal transduction histidine kinase